MRPVLDSRKQARNARLVGDDGMGIKRKATSMAMAALLALGCVALAGCAKTSEDVIREVIQSEFDAYKNLEESALDEIGATAEQEGLSSLGISGDEFAEAVLGGFDYSIDNVKVGTLSATASVTITSKSATDFEARLSDGVQDFVESDDAKSMTTEEKNLKIGDITMQAFEDTELVSEQVDLQFQLQDKTWVSSDAFDVLAELDSLVFAG